MFPSSKLFGLCPDWSTCRVFHCPFSHQPQPSTSSAALPTSTAPPKSGLPQKRPAAATSIDAAPPKRLEQARLAREQGPAQTSSSSREQALALNANTAASASQGTPQSAPPTAVAIVRARLCLLRKNPRLTFLRPARERQSGPPRLVRPRSLSHTPAVTRQKMINALYAQ